MHYQIRTTAQSVITLYVLPETTPLASSAQTNCVIPDHVLQYVGDLSQAFHTLWLEITAMPPDPDTTKCENSASGELSRQSDSTQSENLRQMAHALTDIVPAYHTIAFAYDSSSVSNSIMKRAILASVAIIKERWQQPHSKKPSAAARQVCLPVYYGDEVAWDLPELCGLTTLSKRDIIQQHQNGIYRVSAVGFSPGFAYMQGLASVLQFPRLSAPRVQVPAGALAIAEHQTAIYPQASPGGWRIIGHCPLPLFELSKLGGHHHGTASSGSAESLLTMGDEVRFQAVGKQDYLAILRDNRGYFAPSLRTVFPAELADG